LVDLIENKSVYKFLVGNNGSFDYLVQCVLAKLKEEYKIEVLIVFARLPKSIEETEYLKHETILPEAVDTAPPRFAIDYRNRYMLEKADYVVTYVKRGFGGAQKFKSLAERKNKKVYNLYKR
jgi:uncharacterized phage-like protein YoqJ